MITNKVLKQRVQRGLTWVIEEGPRHGVYLDRVNVETLDLANAGNCVLGQGGEGEEGYFGLQALLGLDTVVQLGFHLSLGGGPRKFRDLYQGFLNLTALWQEAITEHRASVQAMSDELEIALIEGVKV
jgi:hypothetical protein